MLQDTLSKNNEPLLGAINNLNTTMLDLEKHDRKLDEIAVQNQEILKRHEDRLDDHNNRLIVVETILDRNGNPVKKNYHIKRNEED